MSKFVDPCRLMPNPVDSRGGCILCALYCPRIPASGFWPQPRRALPRPTFRVEICCFLSIRVEPCRTLSTVGAQNRSETKKHCKKRYINQRKRKLCSRKPGAMNKNALWNDPDPRVGAQRHPSSLLKKRYSEPQAAKRLRISIFWNVFLLHKMDFNPFV